MSTSKNKIDFPGYKQGIFSSFDGGKGQNEFSIKQYFSSHYNKLPRHWMESLTSWLNTGVHCEWLCYNKSNQHYSLAASDSNTARAQKDGGSDGDSDYKPPDLEPVSDSELQPSSVPKGRSKQKNSKKKQKPQTVRSRNKRKRNAMEEETATDNSPDVEILMPSKKQKVNNDDAQTDEEWQCFKSKQMKLLAEMEQIKNELLEDTEEQIEKAKRYGSDRSALQSRLEASDQKMQDLQRKYGALQQEHSDLKEKWNKAAEKIQVIQAQAEKVKAVLADRDKVKKENVRLVQEHKAAVEKLKESEARQNTLALQSVSNGVELRKLKQETERLQQENTELSVKLESCTVNLENIDAMNEEALKALELKVQGIINSLQQNLKSIKEAKDNWIDTHLYCTICRQNKKEVVLLPCNHMDLCANCESQWAQQTRVCPRCQQQYSNVIKIK